MRTGPTSSSLSRKRKRKPSRPPHRSDCTQVPTLLRMHCCIRPSCVVCSWMPVRVLFARVPALRVTNILFFFCCFPFSASASCHLRRLRLAPSLEGTGCRRGCTSGSCCWATWSSTPRCTGDSWSSTRCSSYPASIRRASPTSCRLFCCFGAMVSVWNLFVAVFLVVRC